MQLVMKNTTLTNGIIADQNATGEYVLNLKSLCLCAGVNSLPELSIIPYNNTLSNSSLILAIFHGVRNVFQQKTTHNYGQARSIRPVGASGTYYNDSVITPSQQPMKSRTKASDVADCTGSWQPARGYLLSGGTPLLFFYDCESTGGNVHDDHIIEIAAEVVGPEEMFVTVKSFSELCFTSRIIGGIGTTSKSLISLSTFSSFLLGCGVNKQMLVGTREFSYVFPDFLSWVNKCVIEVKKAYGKPFYPGMCMCMYVFTNIH